MKKSYTLLIIFIFTLASFSQNLQLHYGFTQENAYTRATFEFIKAREKSLTHIRQDFDIGRLDGVNQAYFEISQKFFIPRLDERINFHLEYNDGLMINRDREIITTGIPIHRSYLAGLGFRGKIGDFVISPTVMFKYYDAYNQMDYQFTLDWYGNFIDEKFTFKGYFDVWSFSPNNNETKYIVFRTQVQVWYNIIKELSVGGEIEFNNHYFIYDDEVKTLVTLALKWNM
jgi:hypothetical protein